MKGKKWTPEHRAKFKKTMRMKRRFRKGGAQVQSGGATGRPPGDRAHDAVVFLKKMEVEIAKSMSTRRARSIDRAALYGLLALDSLTGDPT